MEWLIDIIKEWVLSLAYATIAYVDAEITAVKAWVEAKLYLQKAEYPGYGMPVHVTGGLTPDATCTYFRAGDYNGKPYYRRADGAYFLWWTGAVHWLITTELGGTPAPTWARSDPNVLGDYAPVAPAVGTATVAPGYKYLLTSFVDRGDPAGWDKTHTTIIQDGAWHEWDISAIVPAGSKAVLLRTIGRHVSAAKRIYLRTNGNVHSINVSTMRIQVSGINLSYDAVVALDENRIIEYKADSPAWLTIYFAVGGWWP